MFSHLKNFFDAEEKEKINARARFSRYPADMSFRMYNYVKALRTLQDIYMSIHDEKSVSRVNMADKAERNISTNMTYKIPLEDFHKGFEKQSLVGETF